jgi:hypothetical protein
VQWRVLQEPELFSDVQFFGAQFGGVAVVPSGMVAKLDDLVCGRAHVFGQRHDALVFHGCEPGHDQIREALAAYRDLPKDWGIAVWVADHSLCGSASTEGASVNSVSLDCFPPARAGREVALLSYPRALVALRSKPNRVLALVIAWGLPRCEDDPMGDGAMRKRQQITRREPMIIPSPLELLGFNARFDRTLSVV